MYSKKYPMFLQHFNFKYEFYQKYFQIISFTIFGNLYVEIGDKPFTPELKAMLRKKYHVGNDVFIPTSNIDTSVYKTDEETQDEVNFEKLEINDAVEDLKSNDI